MSSINLSKGQKVDLTKTNPNLKEVLVGLGWNPNETSSGKPYDVDCSVLLLGDNGKLLSDKHFVFYNNLKSPDDFVVHTGDNRTGVGQGDDETVIVNFAKPHNGVKEILFVVTIHEAVERNQNFGQINGSYIRIVNKETNQEIMKFDLNEQLSTETAMTFGKLYLHEGEFKFQAIGTGQNGGLAKYLEMYQ